MSKQPISDQRLLDIAQIDKDVVGDEDSHTKELLAEIERLKQPVAGHLVQSDLDKIAEAARFIIKTGNADEQRCGDVLYGIINRVRLERDERETTTLDNDAIRAIELTAQQLELTAVREYQNWGRRLREAVDIVRTTAQRYQTTTLDEEAIKLIEDVGRFLRVTGDDEETTEKGKSLVGLFKRLRAAKHQSQNPELGKLLFHRESYERGIKEGKSTALAWQREKPTEPCFCITADADASKHMYIFEPKEFPLDNFRYYLPIPAPQEPEKVGAYSMTYDSYDSPPKFNSTATPKPATSSAVPSTEAHKPAKKELSKKQELVVSGDVQIQLTEDYRGLTLQELIECIDRKRRDNG